VTTAIRDGHAVTLTDLPAPCDRRTALIRLAGIRDQIDDRDVQAALARLTPALEAGRRARLRWWLRRLLRLTPNPHPGCRRADWWKRFCETVRDRDRLRGDTSGWDARSRLEDAGYDSAVVDPHAEALACADDLDQVLDAMIGEAGL
jgi:hypothetical protein